MGTAWLFQSQELKSTFSDPLEYYLSTPDISVPINSETLMIKSIFQVEFILLRPKKESLMLVFGFISNVEVNETIQFCLTFENIYSTRDTFEIQQFLYFTHVFL